jgi:pimeloyl-ACP methyl ester carboxylesterase
VSDVGAPLRPQATGGPGITRFAARGGHRLSYESSGARDAAAVITIHDLLADRGQFRSLAEVISQRGFRAALPDARGHGASSAISGREYAVRERVADAFAVLDAEGLSSADVFAVGWGAETALAMAALTPERVRGLVLIEPYLPALLAEHVDPEPLQLGLDQVRAMRAAAEAATKGQTDRALDLFQEARMGLAWRDRVPKGSFAAARRAAANIGPLLTGTLNAAAMADFATIAGPVMVLVGENAPPRERETAQLLRARLPLASVERLPAEPGEPMTLGPDWVAAIVASLEAANRP